jgi:hypothetical protein
MSFNNHNDALNELLFEGLLQELSRMERWWALAEEIARNADRINAEGFGNLFWNIQKSCYSQIEVTLAKVFEPVNNRYPIRSVPVALEILKDHAADLAFERKDFLLAKLAHWGISKDQLQDISGTQITREVHKYFSNKLALADLHAALESLKKSRDKFYAHNEAIDTSMLPTTSFSSALQLIRYVREFLEVVGSGYTSLSYDSQDEWNGDWFHVSHGQEMADNLKLLLVRANIVESDV